MRRLVAIVTVVRVCHFLNSPAPKKRLILNIFLDILCSLFTKIQTVIAFMEEIRWGIIGCGKVTELKSGPAFDEIADSKLVSVMRRTSNKAAEYTRRHNVPKWTVDADKLIEDPDVDAIYIATPPDSHADYIARVTAAGKPAYAKSQWREPTRNASG